MPASMAATASLVSGRVMSMPDTSPAKTGASWRIAMLMRQDFLRLFGGCGGGRDLLHIGASAAQRRATHVAHLVHVVVAPTAVHRGTIVPHHQIVHPPHMRMDELLLRCVFRQVADEGARFRHRPADDAADMRCQVQ